MRRPKVARTLKALDRATAEFATANVALVPTMGALHEGHLSLVRRARRHARRVIVSIFVNPAQFAPHEDLATYPRTWDADVAALAREEVDLIWAPSVGVMYPDGFATQVVPAGPAKPAWRIPSDHISLPASPPWSPSCSCSAARTLRFSVKRTSSSSRSSPG